MVTPDAGENEKMLTDLSFLVGTGQIDEWVGRWMDGWVGGLHK